MHATSYIIKPALIAEIIGLVLLAGEHNDILDDRFFGVLHLPSGVRLLNRASTLLSAKKYTTYMYYKKV